LNGFAYAVNVDPDDLEAQYNLGCLLEQSGKLEDAETHYREALRVDPRHAQSLNNLGVLLCRRGNVQDAIPLFRTALEALPEFDDARVNLDQALALQSGTNLPEGSRNP
jgi:Flp pilus assembly protein TadD